MGEGGWKEVGCVCVCVGRGRKSVLSCCHFDGRGVQPDADGLFPAVPDDERGVVLGDEPLHQGLGRIQPVRETLALPQLVQDLPLRGGPALQQGFRQRLQNHVVSDLVALARKPVRLTHGVQGMARQTDAGLPSLEPGAQPARLHLLVRVRKDGKLRVRLDKGHPAAVILVLHHPAVQGALLDDVVHLHRRDRPLLAVVLRVRQHAFQELQQVALGRRLRGNVCADVADVDREPHRLRPAVPPQHHRDVGHTGRADVERLGLRAVCEVAHAGAPPLEAGHGVVAGQEDNVEAQPSLLVRDGDRLGVRGHRGAGLAPGVRQRAVDHLRPVDQEGAEPPVPEGRLKRTGVLSRRLVLLLLRVAVRVAATALLAVVPALRVAGMPVVALAAVGRDSGLLLLLLPHLLAPHGRRVTGVRGGGGRRSGVRASVALGVPAATRPCGRGGGRGRRTGAASAARVDRHQGGRGERGGSLGVLRGGGAGQVDRVGGRAAPRTRAERRRDRR
eukprot:Rhum_TRINITY_DN14616_c11_g1::Rhum_TRINITY_DN14616_c11_g1_i1::g.102332::m.102332